MCTCCLVTWVHPYGPGCEGYGVGAASAVPSSSFMPRPNGEHADQLIYTDLPYFKAMAKDLNIKLAEVRTLLKDMAIELENTRAEVKRLEDRNAQGYGEAYEAGWNDNAAAY